ncbi:MAG: RidA family protein [Thermodesulfobacteriota bacterium]
MAHEILKLKSVHPTEGYSHVAKAGKTLYIAGQVAKDGCGKLVGLGDFEIQARQVFTNLKNILEEAGGSLQHIVKMTTFLTHFNYREAFRNVRQEFFTEPFPPHTFLVVQSLAMPEYLIEVEAVAVLD